MNFLHIFHYGAPSFYTYTINQYIYLFEKKEQKLKNSLEQGLQRSLKPAANKKALQDNLYQNRFIIF